MTIEELQTKLESLENGQVKKDPSEYSVDYKIRLMVEEAWKEDAYYWQAKDGNATKVLIRKLTHMSKEKNGKPPTDDEILISVKLILEWASRLDFHSDVRDFPTLVGQMHTIIKKGRQLGKSQPNGKMTLKEKVSATDRGLEWLERREREREANGEEVFNFRQ